MEIDPATLIGAAIILALAVLAFWFLRSRTEDPPLPDGTAAGAGAGSRGSAAAVDPIAEAEVYLAYGRRQQAIEILQEALAADPSREDIRKRLAELKAQA